MKQEQIDLIDEWCRVLEIKTNRHISSQNHTYFWFKINKKYTRIVQVDGYSKQDAVHAFVDNKTLDVYKAATWNVPYRKHKKYNLLKNFDQLLNDCEWTGGYLYKSGVKKVKTYGC